VVSGLLTIWRRQVSRAVGVKAPADGRACEVTSATGRCHGRKWSPAATALAGAAVDDLGALLIFSEGVDSGVEGVFEHRDHIAIANRRPVEGHQLLAVGGTREVDLIRRHRQQDLPRAPNSRNLAKIRCITSEAASPDRGRGRSHDARRSPIGTLIRSSPRRALARAASSMRARSTPSSNSLMLPFIPSRSRSFGHDRTRRPCRSPAPRGSH